MRKISFKIDDCLKGERVDIALTELLKGPSRSNIQRLVEKEKVFVNGTPVSAKNYKLKECDFLEVHFDEPSIIEVKPENIPLEIIYEDKDFLIVNKPKGMVVHPALGNQKGTLVNGILFHCKGRLSSINGIIRPGIVHRIDKDTSGLLVVAKNDFTHNFLAKQFAERSIMRVYRAIVYNNVLQDEGTIEAPIGRDPKNRLRMAVTDKNSKHARTHYRVLERFKNFTYIEAILETGRTHQIRVHMAYIRHPLLGDTLYGPKKGCLKPTGQILHAKTIGFIHPETGDYVEFDSNLPDYFVRTLEKLEKI